MNKRIDLFDQLKGISILAIVLFHLGIYNSGFLGVDVFFIISGYFLTLSILKEYKRTEGKINLFKFYKSRFLRLLPGIVILVIAVSIYCRINLKESMFPVINGQAFSSTLLYENWHNIFNGVNYWGDVSSSPLTHLWFSSIIAQVYIVWPLIVIGVLKFKNGDKKILLNVSIILSIISAILQPILFNIFGFNRAYYGTDSRMIAFLLGAIIALQILDDEFKVKSVTKTKKIKMIFVGSLVLIAILWIITTVNSTFLFNGGIILNSILWFIVIKIALTTGITSIPKCKILSQIGLMSFQIYLWHWPVIVILKEELYLNLVFVVVGIIVVSIIGYLLFEKTKFMDKFFVVKQVLLTIIALGIIVLWQPKMSDKHGYDVIVSKHTAENKILVVGDSWARYLGVGMEDISKEKNTAIYNYGVGGFGILNPEFYVYANGEKLESTLYNKNYLKDWHKAAKEFNADVVVMTVGNFDQAIQIIDGEEIRIGHEKFNALYEKKVNEIIDSFLELGIPVVVTNIVDNARDNMSEYDIKVLNSYSDSMSDVMKSAMKKYENNDMVKYFDLDGILSPGTIAPTKTADGEDVYDETNHPAELTAQYIGEKLINDSKELIKTKK